MSFKSAAAQNETLKIVRITSWRFSLKRGFWRHTDGFEYYLHGRQVNIWGEPV